METITEAQKQRIERILHKLDQVRQKGLTCFGAEAHKFRLNSPLDQHEVLRFEEEHQIRLPEDYRNFLVLAGNGGAGPYYGLYKLDQWKDFIEWVCDEVPADILSLPCPLRSDMVRDNDWESRLEGCVSPYQGLITLGTQGCTYEMGLIITGKCAGRVVYLDADGQPPYVVREPDFLGWYERWLDELLGGYEMSWFGIGLGGDESQLLGLLDNRTASETDRIEAVQAMSRLPHLSKRGRERVCNLIDDPVAGVRAAVCYAVKKFEIQEATSSFPGLLLDDSSEVRRAAIAASMSLKPDFYKQDVLQLLHSNEVEVAERAFFSLKEKGLLEHDEMMALVQSSPHGSLRYWSAHAINWEPTHEQLLIRLLRDEHPHVRFSAVLGLRQIRSTASLDAVIGLLDHETDGNMLDNILKMLGEVPGERNVDILLAWAAKGDDFQQLSAVESLCKLGDIRVLPVAGSMLAVSRSPVRRGDHGLNSMTHARTIRQLVTEHLRASPNPKLRHLAGENPVWLNWLTFWKR